MIGPDMLLTITPTKTELTTAKRVTLDLSGMPMVMSELASLRGATPRVEPRGFASHCNGPLVFNEASGMPYTDLQWTNLWRRVRIEAGISRDIWNRDLRAGGTTEGGQSGATMDDRSKVAGHSKPKMTSVYDRDVLVAARRVSVARKAFREGDK
jgi:hypothetical protein